MNWDECFELSDESPSGLIWKWRPDHHFKNARSAFAVNSRQAGKQAGSVALYPNGYKCWKIRAFYKVHQVHRIIFEIVNGPIPKGMSVDHVNGDALDNRKENIRLASHAQNMANSKTRSHNATGIKGVRIYRGKFAARIGGNHIGTFKTADEAKAAYDEAAKARYGEFYTAR
jgi:hypothetical protein